MNLLQLEEDLRSIAASDTAADPEKWTKENPLYGHCAVAACLVQDLVGGTLRNGRKGSLSHYWNVLPGGVETDLTISQFSEQPVWDVILDSKQRDYVLSFPATAERYYKLKARYETLSV